ncbi:transposase domain-containing protein [Desulfosporosinus burensis]
METATANGLDPYEYLVHIFRNLPNLDYRNKTDSLDSHMPWADTLPALFCAKQTSKEAEEGK